MTTNDVHIEDGVRLQKVLAMAGVGSRRACEKLIETGVVEVDGNIVLELGTRIDPNRSVVRVNGERISFSESMITVALNKPTGVLSAMSDPRGRICLTDIVGDRYGRLFHIGRLDSDSEGLILMTNDGDLAETISHPKNEIPKTYIVTVKGKLMNGTLQKMIKGFELEDGFTKFDKARLIGTNDTISVAEVVLHSGKNRIVRRMFDHFDFTVTALVRTQIGSIRLGDLPLGKTRVLGEPEIASLEVLANMPADKQPKNRRPTDEIVRFERPRTKKAPRNNSANAPRKGYQNERKS
jgi:23S rRNA pseudouridine2605 synthase